MHLYLPRDLEKWQDYLEKYFEQLLCKRCEKFALRKTPAKSASESPLRDQILFGFVQIVSRRLDLLCTRTLPAPQN